MASTYSIVGQPVPARVDGTGKVTGVTRYADDLFLPHMLHGKLLRSPHPHARVVGLDTSKAAALQRGLAPSVPLVVTPLQPWLGNTVAMGWIGHDIGKAINP